MYKTKKAIEDKVFLARELTMLSEVIPQEEMDVIRFFKYKSNRENFQRD